MKRNITFTAGCAIDKYEFYLASVLDELDYSDDFSKMLTYNFIEKQWRSYDLEDWKTISVAYNKPTHTLLCLDLYGRLERFESDQHRYEYVEEDIELNKIKVIDQSLYVCGADGKVYKYTDSEWNNLSLNLHETKNITKEELMSLDVPIYLEKYLIDINGFSKNEVYVCGLDRGEGFLAFFDGENWNTINKITPSSLNRIILCPTGENIFVLGSYGTLLKGNIHKGFQNLKDMGITSDFYSGAFYKNIMYIASEDGLYTYINNTFTKVPSIEHIKGTFEIQEKDEVLWILSAKELIRFDGENWEIIHHPDNEEETSNRLKCYAGDRCPESGDWYSPHQVEKRYFAKGDVMPEIENNTWGETIWYLDI